MQTKESMKEKSICHGKRMSEDGGDYLNRKVDDK